MIHQHDSPHFSPAYTKSLEQNKKEYHNWKNAVTTPFTEAHDRTVQFLRPNYETMKR